MLAFATAATLAGCGSDSDATAGTTSTSAAPTGPTETIEFARDGGCGEAFFFAVTQDETFAITVAVDVRDRTEAIDATISDAGGALAAEVEMVRGTVIASGFCNDVLPTEYEITEQTSVASYSGRVRIEGASEADDDGHVSGSVELDEVELPDGTRLGPITMETALIGFYAG